MRQMYRTVFTAVLAASATVYAGAAGAETLTADRAVKIALQRSSQAIAARAGELEARGGLYSAYSQMLPQITGNWNRSATRTDQQGGSQLFGAFVSPIANVNSRSYSNDLSLSGSWSVLNLSAIRGLSSGRASLQSSKMQSRAARNDVALATRRQFYEVVKAIQLAGVADSALRQARNDERRVRALFEVGSVSRSDILKAQVATAQSQLDSLSARQNVVVQRVALADQIGLPEPALGDIDTLLTAEVHQYDEGALVSEASRDRPDLLAAEASLNAANAALSSARLARLPYLSVSGSAEFSPFSSFTRKQFGTFPITEPFLNPDSSIGSRVVGYETDPETSGRSTIDRIYRGTVAINWDIFSGFATDARIASARANVLRALDARDALRRNLEAEVHQSLLDYRRALESREVTIRALDAAAENLNLIQQKYNVGSATILELVDARVNLQRAQSDHVSALAGIRVAEAAIDRVRGRGAD